jgi:hypothetical protein
LAAAEGSSWAAAAAGLALATDGGVVAAPGFFPKNDEMSRCFIVELTGQQTAILLSLVIWLSNSLPAVLSECSASIMHNRHISSYGHADKTTGIGRIQIRHNIVRSCVSTAAGDASL